MSSDSNPLIVAERLGASIGGKLGEIAFQEMELSYVSSTLPHFSENPLIRMRQHLDLYWDASYLKTTLVDEFCKCLPSTIPILNITSNSPEMLFGSINDSDMIVYPAFLNVRIAKITELASFVSGRNMQDIVNTMNKIMEGEWVTRQLLKFGRRELSEAEIQKAEAKGIVYDPERAQLSYQPSTTIFACSRPLDNRTYTHLKTSGHLYRYHVIQKEITDEEAKQYLTSYHKPDITLYAKLRQINEKINALSIKAIDLPDQHITDDIFGHLFSFVENEVQDRNVRLATILDLRTKGDILRELAAVAVIRTIHENDFNDIEKIEYDAKDVDFIKADIGHFVEAKIHPLFVEDFSKPNPLKQRQMRPVKELIQSFLLDGNERTRQEIVTYVLSKMTVSLATIDNALKEMLASDAIAAGSKFGAYRTREVNANHARARINHGH